MRIFISNLAKSIVFLIWSGSLLAAVNVNRADVSQLETLKGMSLKTAQALVFERDTNGVFTSWDDLAARVPGVDKETISGWKDSAICQPPGAFPASAEVEIKSPFPTSSQVDGPAPFPEESEVSVKESFPGDADVSMESPFPANADVPVQDTFPTDAQTKIKDDFPQEAGVSIKDPFAEK